MPRRNNEVIGNGQGIVTTSREVITNENVKSIIAQIDGFDPNDILGILGNPFEIQYIVMFKDKTQYALQCSDAEHFIQVAPAIARKSVEAARKSSPLIANTTDMMNMFQD